ncbi:MAG TPA: tRNA (pseudouridine(54)-N(1))-methyltransferase TrmY [Methanosarcinaceae archaeon]|nr:tRNA (pseudouridine(54)-N(1))-methyltransferase TrmY [Methanosarcinaceae archaeon]
MREFLIIGHKALTSGNFSLNDMPGSAGRMDILCRCTSAALFLSHDMRRDVQVHLLLLGEPDPQKIVRFDGESLRYLNPDERSSGSLIKKALDREVGEQEIRSTPGVWVRRGELGMLLDEFVKKGRKIVYLREDGQDIRAVAGTFDDAVFIMGDHNGVTGEEEEIILNVGATVVNVGPLSLHSEHCVTLINNELDRTIAGD